MVFVRIKKLKGKEYAYLVENEWTINGSRQKVKAYLGRVIKPLRKKEKITDVRNLDYKQAVLALVKQELLNHGFDENLALDDVKADLAEIKFINKGRNIVLALNEGFLCSQTLKDALDIELTGYEEEAGTQLAKALLELGLKLPKDIFVQLFEKIYKGNKNTGE
ncbi:hypothetical protein KY346_04035 [Candidatus Woesearchaeota archaeon]|nr:hypothetical protein [Candidatus Woesearchaeota archaeon]